MKCANVKKRNWAFVLYPDSAPSDWIDQLQATGLTCAISPLHDRDVNPDGECKKAHYHIILCYAGPTSYNVVISLTDSLNQPIPQALEQVKGYYRYFTHMDNPDKYQYDPVDIRLINGFDIANYSELTRSELANIKKQLIQLIREYCITEYSDFMDFVMAQCDASAFDVASNNTLFFDRYISSARHKLDNTP